MIKRQNLCSRPLADHCFTDTCGNDIPCNRKLSAVSTDILDIHKHTEIDRPSSTVAFISRIKPYNSHLSAVCQREQNISFVDKRKGKTHFHKELKTENNATYAPIRIIKICNKKK